MRKIVNVKILKKGDWILSFDSEDNEYFLDEILKIVGETLYLKLYESYKNASYIPAIMSAIFTISDISIV